MVTRYTQRSFSVAGWKAPEGCDHSPTRRWLTVTGYCVRCGLDCRELIQREIEDAAEPTDTAGETRPNVLY